MSTNYQLHKIQSASMFKITPRPLKVMVVSDNYYNVEKIRESLFENRILHTISVTMDFTQSVTFLDSFGEMKGPDIIVIVDSDECSNIIKHIKLSKYKELPIVVLLINNQECRCELADFHIHPPISSNDFFDIMERLPKLFLTCVEEEDVV